MIAIDTSHATAVLDMTRETRRRRRPTRLKAAREKLRRKRARRNYLDYLCYVWWSVEQLKIGLHTRLISERLTRAVDDYLQGISTYLIIMVPFRHGKSDMCSRAFPGYFLGRCSLAGLQPDVMTTGYGSSLIHRFSRRARSIVESEQYQRLFPDIRLGNRRTDAFWQVEYYNRERCAWQLSSGEINAAGLLGGLTGSGYAAGICDDYCKSRAEAESETIRDKTWDAFTNDFLSRRASVNITILVATPWNVDDVIARARKRTQDDPLFPKFEIIKFPATGPGYIDGELIDYPSKHLFPERFSEKWYEESYGMLGSYASAGLLDCEPVARSGNIFDVSRVKIHDTAEGFPDCLYSRFWDLASTEKQTQKDDPDFTCGALVGLTFEEPESENRVGLVPHLWIKDVVLGQWEAPRRDRRIIANAQRDGATVPILVEGVGGYKDAARTIRNILSGLRSVITVRVSTDKVVRAEPLEAIFEAGHVHVVRGGWNAEFLKQFKTFPQGHDDAVDAVSGAYHYLFRRSGRDQGISEIRGMAFGR